MPRMDRLSNYATTISERNGNTCITYHETVIVEFDREHIILRTGGWDTVTTRRKMNQASRQFDLGYGVFRIKGETCLQTDASQCFYVGSPWQIDRASGVIKVLP